MADDDVREPERDLMLQLLAHLAQSGSLAGLGITLQVHGQLLTGTIIGRTDWLAELTRTADSANAGVGAFVGALAAGVESKLMPPDDEATFDTYGYLHLRDARFTIGNHLTGNGVLWRVRISSIDSWTLGTISA